MKSLRLIYPLMGIVGALMVVTDAYAYETPTAPEILPQGELLAKRMKTHGIRTEIFLHEDSQQKELISNSQSRVTVFDHDCELESASEIYLEGESAARATESSFAGYEVLYYCEDAPAPAIGFYYNRDHAFLMAISLGN